MFPLNMLKTIEKFAWLLLIPLVALGFNTDFPLHHSSDANAGTNMVVGIVFACIEALVAIVLIDHALFVLDRHMPEDMIFGLVGVLLLTFCLYGVSLFYHQLPPSPFKPIWHLAAGCYAFALFERNAFFASLRSK